MDRPVPNREVPEGYELVAVEAGPDWRTETGRRCRRQSGASHRACHQPAVAALNRSRQKHVRGTGYVTVPEWWPYCPEHLYGRWIEDGKVMHWILREKTDD